MLSLFPQDSKCPLPSFKTLLVTGNYHPSAPIHLALSYLADSGEGSALIMTESRQSLFQPLAMFDNECALQPPRQSMGWQSRLNSQVAIVSGLICCWYLKKAHTFAQMSTLPDPICIPAILPRARCIEMQWCAPYGISRSGNTLWGLNLSWSSNFEWVFLSRFWTLVNADGIQVCRGWHRWLLI